MARNPNLSRIELEEPSAARDAAEALGGPEVRARRPRRNRRSRKRRQNCSYGALSLPTVSSIIEGLFGIWILFVFISIKWDCDEEFTIVEKPNGITETTTGNVTWMDYNAYETFTDVACSNFERYYPTTSVILWSVTLILAAGSRLRIMTSLWQKNKENLQENSAPQHMKGYILLTFFLVLVVILYTAMLYDPWRQKEVPLESKGGFYDFHLHVSIIFYFCIVDALITLLPLIFMEIWICIDLDGDAMPGDAEDVGNPAVGFRLSDIRDSEIYRRREMMLQALEV